MIMKGERERALKQLKKIVRYAMTHGRMDATIDVNEEAKLDISTQDGDHWSNPKKFNLENGFLGSLAMRSTFVTVVVPRFTHVPERAVVVMRFLKENSSAYLYLMLGSGSSWISSTSIC